MVYMYVASVHALHIVMHILIVWGYLHSIRYIYS